MKIEHFAIQVADSKELAIWYEKHLGMTTKRSGPAPADARFIADSSGTVMIEVYNNPAASTPNYSEMHPLLVHLAFVSEDVQADKTRLIAAGCTEFSDDVTPDGDKLVMLRDPWGIALQLCQRKDPMI
ncbi:VOC family protein [Persicirhabdus sediminis]|uniref:VOC family protein n=1 Tax=Persicirhabdus sediminis TaxID=454144 RepID=A0A8J7MC10_9BACT|nr:VOC family protein [Persicirhabdus sediminis]MBK1790854.1 VOC family protein [Persicirhabdus sediminis]